MKDKLTLKQQAFIDAYLGEAKGNATEAYELAGYEGKGNVAEAAASRLLRNVKIARAIEKARAERAARVNITNDLVLKNIIANAEEAREAKNFSAAIKGWELVGKDLGMFPNRLEADVKNTVTIEDARVSELDSFFREAAEQRKVMANVGKDGSILPH